MLNVMFITATVYKSPLDLDKVREMINAGASILRIKFAHVSYEEAVQVIKKIKKLIDFLGTDTKILADLPEHKVRLGGLEKGKENVVSDKIYTMRPGKFSKTIDDFVPVALESIEGCFEVGDKISIGDGEVSFDVVESVSLQEVRIKFPKGGFVDQYRSLMSHRLADSLPHCDVAVASLSLFKNVRPDYLALSFVDSGDYINRFKRRIKELYGDEWQPKILAKIESPQGLANIQEIAELADEIVLARGDLGLTTDYTRVILEQKRVCEVGRKNNTPVVVATQILESCLQKAIPARSEIADLTNIMLDGASGIWLSQETSLHHSPGQVVGIAKKIINAIKSEL